METFSALPVLLRAFILTLGVDDVCCCYHISANIFIFFRNTNDWVYIISDKEKCAVPRGGIKIVLYNMYATKITDKQQMTRKFINVNDIDMLVTLFILMMTSWHKTAFRITRQSLCAGSALGTDVSPNKGPVMQIIDEFIAVSLKTLFNKQSSFGRCETP